MIQRHMLQRTNAVGALTWVLLFWAIVATVVLAIAC